MVWTLPRAARFWFCCYLTTVTVSMPYWLAPVTPAAFTVGYNATWFWLVLPIGLPCPGHTRCSPGWTATLPCRTGRPVAGSATYGCRLPATYGPRLPVVTVTAHTHVGYCRIYTRAPTLRVLYLYRLVTQFCVGLVLRITAHFTPRYWLPSYGYLPTRLPQLPTCPSLRLPGYARRIAVVPFPYHDLVCRVLPHYVLPHAPDLPRVAVAHYAVGRGYTPPQFGYLVCTRWPGLSPATTLHMPVLCRLPRYTPACGWTRITGCGCRCCRYELRFPVSYTTFTLPRYGLHWLLRYPVYTVALDLRVTVTVTLPGSFYPTHLPRLRFYGTLLACLFWFYDAVDYTVTCRFVAVYTVYGLVPHTVSHVYLDYRAPRTTTQRFIYTPAGLRVTAFTVLRGYTPLHPFTFWLLQPLCRAFLHPGSFGLPLPYTRYLVTCLRTRALPGSVAGHLRFCGSSLVLPPPRRVPLYHITPAWFCRLPYYALRRLPCGFWDPHPLRGYAHFATLPATVVPHAYTGYPSCYGYRIAPPHAHTRYGYRGCCHTTVLAGPHCLLPRFPLPTRTFSGLRGCLPGCPVSYPYYWITAHALLAVTQDARTYAFFYHITGLPHTFLAFGFTQLHATTLARVTVATFLPDLQARLPFYLYVPLDCPHGIYSSCH